jgi:hypothetical protein
MPPVLNVRTPDQVADALRRLVEMPGLRDGLGQAGRQWYELYHSNAVIMERFLQTIRPLLDRSEPASGPFPEGTYLPGSHDSAWANPLQGPAGDSRSRGP